MLSGMALFKDLSAEGLADAATRGRVRNVARGAVIFSQGDDASACHALLEGRVRITQSNEDGAELLVRFIGPGEMFGTVGLFTDGRYPAEAVAVLDSIEIHWPEPVLSDLLARHPPIALNMVRIIGARLRDMQERLREVGLLRVERRIAHVLPARGRGRRWCRRTRDNQPNSDGMAGDGSAGDPSAAYYPPRPQRHESRCRWERDCRSLRATAKLP